MEQAVHTSCYTYFRIVGDFNPDMVSELLSLKPEKSWKIGDIRKNGTAYDFSAWYYGLCKEYDVETDKQLKKTIASLVPKVDILQEIRQRYDVRFYLEVVPSLVYDETTPCLAPSLEVMKFCLDTQTEMDIDLYMALPGHFDKEA